jgi:F-type H+-transporting ATPase subunit a
MNTLNIIFLLDPLEQFEVETSISSITNIALFLGFLFILIVMLFNFLANNGKLLPGVYTSLNFKLLLFLKTLVKENVNSPKVNYYLFILSLFYFITLCNLVGMVPYSFTLTSHLTITFFIALFTFFGINLIGIRTHGIKFVNLFLPAGTPLLVIPFLIVVEIISYVARVFSLSIRLFANMMSGHTLLKILSGFVWSNLLSLSSTNLWFLAIIPFLIVLAVTVLELLIAFLQAYVFVILTAIYLNDVLNMH